MNPYYEPRQITVPRMPRFPRRTSVTIAAGFKCTDGLVLCADTQETVDGYRKRNVPKITVRPTTNPIPAIKTPRRKSDPKPKRLPPSVPELIVGFAGAGDSAFLEKLIEKAWLGIAQASNYAERCSKLEEEVTQFFERYWPIYSDSMKPEAELLVGLWSPSEVELFKVVGPLVTRVDNHAFIGWGGHEAETFADRLDMRKLTFKKASSVGIYILKAVKERVPSCGGDTHLLLMRDNGHVYFENPWKIRWAEEKLRRLEQAVGPLIIAAASGEADSDEFQESLDEFGGKLLVIKEELKKIERALDAAGDYRPGK